MRGCVFGQDHWNGPRMRGCLKKNARFPVDARMFLHTCLDGAPVGCRVLHYFARRDRCMLSRDLNDRVVPVLTHE